MDHLRGYEKIGAVDYVPVPIVPEVLRAKARVFIDLYRKTRQLEQLNRDLEARVAERTAELASSSLRLREAEQLRRLALAAGRMGSWGWDVVQGTASGMNEIFGVLPHATIKDAVLAATKNELQGGILDVNVRGEKVYAVADLLISRNVPFVFVTGYAADSIDARFRDVPVLQKPIEPQRLWAALAKSSQQMPDTATSQIPEGSRRSDRVADVTK